MMAGVIRGNAMPALVGPLFFWDVVRLARRGRGTALRFFYGAALLGALAFVYAGEFGAHNLLSLSGDSLWVSLDDQARFAHRFASALMLAQNFAVLVLVPAYLAGAVAEEKEKKTLDLLFTTALTDREIVVGKLLGRLAHVGGVLLAGLPVLALAQLWGGVEPSVVLANFAVAGLTLLSVGGVSLVCSCLANTALSALVLSYGAAAMLGVGCLCSVGDFAFSPLAFPFALDRRLVGAEPGAAPLPGTGEVAAQMVIMYAAVHGGIGLIAVVFAMAVLRPTEPRSRSAPTSPLPEVLPRLPPGLVLPPELEGVYRPSPPVGDHALLWKEVLLGTGRYRPRLWDELGAPLAVALVIPALVWGFLGLVALPPTGRFATEALVEMARVFNGMVRGGAVLLLTMACAAVGFRAAGSVVRERARGTLDGLLTLPLPREAILRAKWLGSLLRTRIVLYLVAAGWLFGLCTGALHPLAVPLAAVTVAAQLAFVASLGLWVSLHSRSIPRAHFGMAFLLLVFFVGGWLLWLGMDANWGGGRGGGDGINPLLLVLTPWGAWWGSMFPLVGSGSGDQRVRDAAFLVASAGWYLLWAAVLWRAAVKRLRQEPGPVPSQEK
jgi:ABC-type transport system involved in multi-copper enzyme maturation permease subunit